MRLGKSRRTLWLLLSGRWAIFASVIAYVFLLTWIYREMISPRWAGYGFTYEDPETLASVVGWIGALLPAFWMPLAITRPSQALYWQLYLTVYLPSMFIPYYMASTPLSKLVPVTVYLFAGFALVGLQYRIPLRSMPVAHITTDQFWGVLAVSYMLTMGPYLIQYAPHLRLVSFTERYELRLADREVDSGILMGYCRNWLAFTLNPLLLSIGLLRRRPALFLMGAAGAVLLYASAASRAWLIVVAYLPMVYFAFRKNDGKRFGLLMLFITNCLFLFIIGLELFGSSYGQDFSDLFAFRDHSVPGAFTEQYARFFETHPFTYWSHVKGINLLIQFPYEHTIPFEVGNFLSPGNTDLSANAHLWATDGIAAIGPVGILVISFPLALVFYLLDCCTKRHAPWVSGLIVIMQYANLANIGLVSTVFGGGLLFTTFLLWLMPPSVGEGVTAMAARGRVQNRNHYQNSWPTPSI